MNIEIWVGDDVDVIDAVNFIKKRKKFLSITPHLRNQNLVRLLKRPGYFKSTGENSIRLAFLNKSVGNEQVLEDLVSFSELYSTNDTLFLSQLFNAADKDVRIWMTFFSFVFEDMVNIDDVDLDPELIAFLIKGDVSNRNTIRILTSDGAGVNLPIDSGTAQGNIRIETEDGDVVDMSGNFQGATVHVKTTIGEKN